jgi:hypothetical protein
MADEVLFSYMTPLSKRSRAGPSRCTTATDGSAITKQASIREEAVLRTFGRKIGADRRFRGRPRNPASPG